MTRTWHSNQPAPVHRITPVGWLLVALRAVVLIILVFGGLVVLLLVRMVERPVWGLRRPLTPYITQGVCKGSLRVIGLRLKVRGAPAHGQEAVVANHTSWLDIFVLNASKRIYFVSKAEVAGWPGIGWLARATGTVFIERDAAKARTQTIMFRERLLAGHKLLFFPEGTSTDGFVVLPFKTTLFQSFFDPGLKDALSVQPVSVVYHAPKGREDRFYGWWGDMPFGPHLIQTLSSWSRGHVDVMYHDPLKVNAFSDRKALARACEEAVREGHETLQGKAD
jgi:1-acyl-sn-glycerol-3-phosphate acyltransferase